MAVKQLLSGNEAIALAAFDAKVAFGAGYPGTPSSEILDEFAKLGGKAQWSPNEKTALENAIGGAFGQVRTLATMKHVALKYIKLCLKRADYFVLRPTTRGFSISRLRSLRRLDLNLNL